MEYHLDFSEDECRLMLHLCSYSVSMIDANLTASNAPSKTERMTLTWTKDQIEGLASNIKSTFEASP